MTGRTEAVVRFLTSPTVQVRFNGAAWVCWLVMVPVTLLVAPLRTAILYVALMSVWANFATHLGAWIAALVNVRAERIDDRTAEHASLAHIEGLAAQNTEVLGQLVVQGDRLAALLDHHGVEVPQ